MARQIKTRQDKTTQDNTRTTQDNTRTTQDNTRTTQDNTRQHTVRPTKKTLKW